MPDVYIHRVTLIAATEEPTSHYEVELIAQIGEKADWIPFRSVSFETIRDAARALARSVTGAKCQYVHFQFYFAPHNFGETKSDAHYNFKEGKTSEHRAFLQKPLNESQQREFLQALQRELQKLENTTSP